MSDWSWVELLGGLCLLGGSLFSVLEALALCDFPISLPVCMPAA